MSGISIGQAIGIIGGVPILRNVLGHTIDGLKIPRHLDIGSAGTSGSMQGLLSSVMSGGPGALLQSPLGSSLGSLSSAITGAISALNAGASSSSSGSDSGSGDGTSGSGNQPSSYQPLITALGSLSTSATGLSALADNLVGYVTNPNLPGQLDVIAHAGVVQALGTGTPAALALSTVLAPTSSTGLLTAAQAGVQSVVAQVLAGTMAVSDAVTATAAQQTGLDQVTNASTGALAASQAAAPALAAAQSAIALLVAGPPELTAAMLAAIRPDVLPIVQAIVAAHNEAIGVAASSQAAAAAAIAAIVAAQEAGAAQYPDS